MNIFAHFLACAKVSKNYSALLKQFNIFRMLLNKIEGLQGELGLPIDSWTTTWKSIGSASCEIVGGLVQNVINRTNADILPGSCAYSRYCLLFNFE